MNKLNFITLFLLVFSFSSNAKKNLFEDMDEEARLKTGLHKLTESEQLALSKWIDFSKEKVVKEEKKKFMGFKRESSEREEIHSFIIGEFRGWKGNAVFKLENGQVWKQSGSGSFYIPKRQNPKITIKPKSMGSWMLYVDGFGTGVKVKRVK